MHLSRVEAPWRAIKHTFSNLLTTLQTLGSSVSKPAPLLSLMSLTASHTSSPPVLPSPAFTVFSLPHVSWLVLFMSVHNIFLFICEFCVNLNVWPTPHLASSLHLVLPLPSLLGSSSPCICCMTLFAARLHVHASFPPQPH